MCLREAWDSNIREDGDNPLSCTMKVNPSLLRKTIILTEFSGMIHLGLAWIPNIILLLILI